MRKESGEHGDWRVTDIDNAHSFARLFAAPLYGRIVTMLVCLFLGFCTAIGPIYRHRGSLAQFGWRNVVIFAIAAVIYWLIIVDVTWISRWHHGRSSAAFLARQRHLFWWLFAILLIGWAWVPIVLRTGFGADLNSQIAEVQQWLYGVSPADVFHARTPAYESYPIARYLILNSRVRLTDQHNIVLTLFYGLVANESYELTGSVRSGIYLLSVMQYVFAAFCMASAFARFVQCSPRAARWGVGGVALAALLLSPMVALSTVALTKSPFFSFAYVWWTGVLYELLHGRRIDGTGAARGGKGVGSESDALVASVQSHPRWQTVTAFIISTLAMLISAKFALYIVAIELVLLLIFRARSWKIWLIGLLVPAAVFSIGLHGAEASGLVVAGDSIEAKGIQIQQVARIEKTDPKAIDARSRAALNRIFDLPDMAKAYDPISSEPVKSSGEYRRLDSYRWQTVTAVDWKGFTGAWWQAVTAAPGIATDALLAKMYGYFDITDKPSTPITYYSGAHNDVMVRMLGAKAMRKPARVRVIRFLMRWERTPMASWLLHGNFWLIATLLLICVQLRNRRGKEFLWTAAALLQMAVAAAAPANNFDRLEIGFALVAPLLLIDALSSGNGSAAQRIGSGIDHPQR